MNGRLPILVAAWAMTCLSGMILLSFSEPMPAFGLFALGGGMIAIFASLLTNLAGVRTELTAYWDDWWLRHGSQRPTGGGTWSIVFAFGLLVGLMLVGGGVALLYKG